MKYRKQYIVMLILNLFVFYSANPAYLPIFIIEPSLVFFIIEEPVSFFSLAFILLLAGQLLFIHQMIAKKHVDSYVNIGITSLLMGIIFLYLGISEVDDEPAVPIITSIPFLTAICYYFIKRYSYKE
jgi:hypothetical protein